MIFETQYLYEWFKIQNKLCETSHILLRKHIISIFFNIYRVPPLSQVYNLVTYLRYLLLNYYHLSPIKGLPLLAAWRSEGRGDVSLPDSSIYFFRGFLTVEQISGKLKNVGKYCGTMQFDLLAKVVFFIQEMHLPLICRAPRCQNTEAVWS